MSDVEERLQIVKKSIESATFKKAQLEHEKSIAQASQLDMLNQLKDKFGVSSLEEAKSLLVTLKKDLDQKLTEAEDKLREVSLDS